MLSKQVSYIREYPQNYQTPASSPGTPTPTAFYLSQETTPTPICTRTFPRLATVQTPAGESVLYRCWLMKYSTLCLCCWIFGLGSQYRLLLRWWASLLLEFHDRPTSFERAVPSYTGTAGLVGKRVTSMVAGRSRSCFRHCSYWEKRSLWWYKMV